MNHEKRLSFRGTFILWWTDWQSVVGTIISAGKVSLFLVWNGYGGCNLALRVTDVRVWYHKMFFAVVDTKEIPYIGHLVA